MPKKFNDVVLYLHNIREKGELVSKASNALVISSSVHDGREFLQLLYLDAAFDRPLLSGADVQNAMKIVFSAPHVEPTVQAPTEDPDKPKLPPPPPAQGWKDVEIAPENFIETMQTNFADESAAELNKTHECQEKLDAITKQAEELTAEVATLRAELEGMNQNKVALLKEIEALKNPPSNPPAPPTDEVAHE